MENVSELVFSTQQAACECASALCKLNKVGARIEGRGSEWAVIFYRPIPVDKTVLQTTGSTSSQNNAGVDAELLAVLQEREEEITALRAVHREEVTLLKQEIAALEKINAITDAEHLLLASIVAPVIEPSPSKWLRDDVVGYEGIIARYGYIQALYESGKIDDNRFKQFSKLSGLSEAISKRAKLAAADDAAARGVFDIRGPRKRPALCEACGAPVDFGGYCKCS